MKFLGLGEQLLALARGARFLGFDQQRELGSEAFDEVALRKRERCLQWNMDDQHAERRILPHEGNVKTLSRWQGVGKTAGFLSVAPGPVRHAALLFRQGQRTGIMR